MENIQDQCRLQFQQFGSDHRLENGVEALMASKTSGNHDFSDDGDFNGPDQESVVSDSESGISGPSVEQLEWRNGDLVKLVEQDKIYDLIERRFVNGLGILGPQTTVSAVYKNSHSTHVGQARLHAFQIYSQAIAKKNGGNANVQYAWLGASKDQINNILGYGFAHCNKPESSQFLGRGVYLSPDALPLERSELNSISTILFFPVFSNCEFLTPFDCLFKFSAWKILLLMKMAYGIYCSAVSYWGKQSLFILVLDRIIQVLKRLILALMISLHQGNT